MTAFSNSKSLTGYPPTKAFEEEQTRPLNAMVGNSAPMRRLAELIAKVAPTDATVLVHGETGTGKELAARAIHGNSRRSAGRLVTVNCAAIPEPLLESELFGYMRGAFTGASVDKPGKLEMAHGGTLFLDEVGELPMSLQAKLLRAIQEREVDRLGSAKPVRVDVRIIAATNADLAAGVTAKTFRQDLYYRLAVVAIRTPPLRERREDIIPLSEYFLTKLSAAMGRKAPAITSEASDCMCCYPWPGNVRELQNTLEHAIVFGSQAAIYPWDLPEKIRDRRIARGGSATGFAGAVQDFKRQLILETLEQTGGNFIKSAKILGIHPNSVHRLVQKLGLRRRSGARASAYDVLKEQTSEQGDYERFSVHPHQSFPAAV